MATVLSPTDRRVEWERISNKEFDELQVKAMSEADGKRDGHVQANED